MFVWIRERDASSRVQSRKNHLARCRNRKGHQSRNLHRNDHVELRAERLFSGFVTKNMLPKLRANGAADERYVLHIKCNALQVVLLRALASLYRDESACLIKCIIYLHHKLTYCLTRKLLIHFHQRAAFVARSIFSVVRVECRELILDLCDVSRIQTTSIAQEK